MKKLLTLALLSMLPALAEAQDSGLELGVYGGGVWMDSLEVLDTTWTIVPRVGYWIDPTLGVEVDFGILSGQTSLGRPDTYSFLALTPRVNFLGRVLEDEPVNLLLAAGFGGMFKSVDDAGELDLPTAENMDVDFLASAGPGLAVPIGPLAIRADLRWLLNLGSENYQNRGDAFLNWEVTGGLMYTFGGPQDADGDGIVDEDDECPDQAEDMDEFEDMDGCPDTDNDGDGISDASDGCANDAEDMDGFEDEDGCPEADNDGDGIVDGEDECPLESGPKGTMGCPDADNDGITDTEDECPDDAGEKKAFGCPDGDGDRVPDYRDDCPEEAAPAKINPLRSDGCPGRVYVTAEKIVITEKVQFDTGKATIKSDSHGLLDDIHETLTKFGGIKKLQVEGHTDSQGNDDKNMKLSEDRAAAVVTYLTEKGIAADRLVAKGFGETKPIGDNETAEGRAQNRRVEFNILEQDLGGKTKRKGKRKGKKMMEEAHDDAMEKGGDKAGNPCGE